VAGFYGMGATVVSQPVLAVDDEAKLVDEAFKDALKKADDQAKQVARRQMETDPGSGFSPAGRFRSYLYFDFRKAESGWGGRERGYL
jgi:hypothetical protein